MPPNTLRVHTEYVFVKSVGPKVLWARVQGTGEYFPPIQFLDKIMDVEIGGSPFIVPSGNFTDLIRTVTYHCSDRKLIWSFDPEALMCLPVPPHGG
ncbi:hypothetical protein TNCV_1346371 [Trichonephila clavipes]|nr:hypothetical protein TNCV_1346371 [Trichonephila clavipes]